MTRHGPLTAQGLGRSPYDEVFQGTGEANPREPIQRYDERGRPINPETRRINRDVIRSHNEIMQVIGVAEPDNYDEEKKLEESMQELDRHETQIGNTLYNIGMLTSVSTGWVIKAMKYRNLLYKRYHHVSLVDIWGFEQSQRSFLANVGAGYPALALEYFVQLRQPFRDGLGTWWSRCYSVLSRWVRLHLNVYAALQQVEIYPASHVLPNWRFFVPFSSMSPIPAPPPPADFTASEMCGWVGKAAISATPLLVIILCDLARNRVTEQVFYQVYRRLPFPMNRKRPSERPSAPRAATVPPAPEELPQPSAQAPVPVTPQPVEDESVTEPPVNPRTVRRQSTLSTSHGPTTATTSEAVTALDLDTSDDEEYRGAEMVSRTLISFDVDAPDVVDPAPGIWSAELRANGDQHAYINPVRDPGGTRTYRVNSLTEMPAQLAAIIMAAVPARVLMAPCEGITLRLLVKLILGSRGLSTGDIYAPCDLLPWGAVANHVGLELVHFLAQAEIWAAMYQLASWCRFSEEDWKQLDEEDEAERRRNN